MSKEQKKQPRFNNGRMYVQVRNSSLVGLRDLPEHLKTGTSSAQLTPIFSISLENIEEAFAAQATGQVENYMERIVLRAKYSSSKLDVRVDANPDSFGYIEDINILKQLPYEFDALLKALDSRFKSFLGPFTEAAINQVAEDINLVVALGLNKQAKKLLKNELKLFS